MSDTEKADAGVAAPVQFITTATRNLKSQPFIQGDDPDSQRKNVERLARRNRIGIQILQGYETVRQERCTHHLWRERNRSPAWRKVCQTRQMAPTTMKSRERS